MPYSATNVTNDGLISGEKKPSFDKEMKRPYSPLSQLVLLALAVCFAATAAAVSGGETRRRPGFIYSRNRGRCTPQYWSSRREAWPRMIPQGSTVSKVFGSRAYERYRYDLTLLEATSRNDDAENVFARLLKEATAALINAYARKGFTYTAWEVKTWVIEGLVSKKAAAIRAQQLYEANEACN